MSGERKAEEDPKVKCWGQVEMSNADGPAGQALAWHGLIPRGWGRVHIISYFSLRGSIYVSLEKCRVNSDISDLAKVRKQ
jgi:hypothetical protein